MSRHELDAVFEQGVFRPLDSDDLHLADGERVRIVVEPMKPIPHRTPDEILEMAARVYEGLSPEEIDEIEGIALNRSRFFEGRNLNDNP